MRPRNAFLRDIVLPRLYRLRDAIGAESHRLYVVDGLPWGWADVNTWCIAIGFEEETDYAWPVIMRYSNAIWQQILEEKNT